MKKHFLLFIGLLFNLGVCYSVDFTGNTLKNAVAQSKYRDKKDSILKDNALQADFEEKNKLFKEYFNSVEGNYKAYSTVGDGSSFGYPSKRYKWNVFKYILAIQGDNYLIHLYDAYPDDEGIHGYARILINVDEKTCYSDKFKKAYFIINFTDLCFRKDGTIESGFSDDNESNVFQISGEDRIYLKETCLKKDVKDYLICVEKAVHELYGSEKVNIGKYMFSMDGKIISSEPCTEEQTIKLGNFGARATYSMAKWDGKTFTDEYTRVTFPYIGAEFNGPDFTYTISEKKLTENLIIKPKNKNVRFRIKNDLLSADSVTFLYPKYGGGDKMIVENAVVYFGNNSKKLGNFEAVNGEFAFYLENCKDRLKILADDDIVEGYRFDSKNGLTLSFKSKFPDQEKAVYYDVCLDKEGNYWWNGYKSVKHLSYSFKQTKVEGKLANISDGKLNLYDAKLIFPENSCLAGQTITKDFISILPDGTLSAQCAAPPNFFDIGSVYCDSFQTTKDGILIKGKLDNHLIVELDNFCYRDFKINRLLIGFDGLVKDFDIQPNKSDMTLASGWRLSAKKTSVRVNQTADKEGKLSPAEVLICFDDCKLMTPMNSGREEFSVKNLKYRVMEDSAGFVLDDLILPDGINLDLKEVFGRKPYKYSGSLHASFREITEIKDNLNHEAANLMKRGLFTSVEKYEYDKKGRIIRHSSEDFREDWASVTRYEYEDEEGKYTQKIYVKNSDEPEEYRGSCTVWLNEAGQKTEDSSGSVWKYDDNGNLIEYGKKDRNGYEAIESWKYNDKNQIIQHEYNLYRKDSSKEVYEYSEDLLFRKIVFESSDRNRTRMYFYSYDQNNRPVKTSGEYGLMDKWGYFKTDGIGEPVICSYNQNGNVIAEKEYSYFKYYEYEFYPDSRVKTKYVYTYNYPSSDM